MKLRFLAILIAFPICSCGPVTITPVSNVAATSTQLTSPVEFPERVEFSMLSPDESKIIQTKDWLTFEIFDIKTNIRLWSFSYDTKKFGEGNEVREGGYSPFYWSKDGKYIYVFARQGWDGGYRYYGDVFGAEEGVARFDVDTGTMTEILPEIYGGGYTFAISPDEQGIIYTDQREFPLVLRWRSLYNDDERIILDFDETVFDVGKFGWSPEMDKLIFETVAVENPFESNQEFIYSLFMIDLQETQPQLLIDGLKERLSFQAWNSQDQVLFTDFENVVWQLDLGTKVIRALGTATPSP